MIHNYVQARFATAAAKTAASGHRQGLRNVRRGDHDMTDGHEPRKTGIGGAERTVAGAEAPAATGPYFTELFLTSADPSPDDTGTFVPRSTPGNVGVCLSGGGSRAFSAGIGQLQALETLQANGSSLLNQTRALSTVSGGGWIGIPFVFLPASVSDSDFLGTYV